MTRSGTKCVTIGAVLPLALLSACGGGGGGGGVESTPVPVAAPVAAPAPTPAPRPPPPATVDYDTARYRRSNGAVQAQAIAAYAKNVTGAGVLVRVIDSGVNAQRPEFAGRISALSTDYAGSRTLGDEGGHGTAVSAVLLAAKNDSHIHGVAFGATLLALHRHAGQLRDQARRHRRERLFAQRQRDRRRARRGDRGARARRQHLARRRAAEPAVAIGDRPRDGGRHHHRHFGGQRRRQGPGGGGRSRPARADRYRPDCAWAGDHRGGGRRDWRARTVFEQGGQWRPCLSDRARCRGPLDPQCRHAVSVRRDVVFRADRRGGGRDAGAGLSQSVVGADRPDPLSVGHRSRRGGHRRGVRQRRDQSGAGVPTARANQPRGWRAGGVADRQCHAGRGDGGRRYGGGQCGRSVGGHPRWLWTRLHRRAGRDDPPGRGDVALIARPGDGDAHPGGDRRARASRVLDRRIGRRAAAARPQRRTRTRAGRCGGGGDRAQHDAEVSASGAGPRAWCARATRPRRPRS